MLPVLEKKPKFRKRKDMDTACDVSIASNRTERGGFAQAEKRQRALMRGALLKGKGPWWGWDDL